MSVRNFLFPALLLGLCACTPASNQTGDAFTRTGQIIAMGGGEGGASNACFTCHGLDGLGDGVSVPRLAGLDAGYLQKQMEDYAGDVRQNAVMTEVARWLDDDDRRAVSAWYASLPTGQHSPEPSTATPTIYARGDPARGIVACGSCHGDVGQGLGTANPALAGQPAAYTIDQLEQWQKGKRRNDPRGVMAEAVSGLTHEEIRAIAVWLHSVPASRSPDNDVAKASAAATASAQPAASHGIRRPDR